MIAFLLQNKYQRFKSVIFFTSYLCCVIPTSSLMNYLFGCFQFLPIGLPFRSSGTFKHESKTMYKAFFKKKSWWRKRRLVSSVRYWRQVGTKRVISSSIIQKSSTKVFSKWHRHFKVFMKWIQTKSYVVSHGSFWCCNHPNTLFLSSQEDTRTFTCTVCHKHQPQTRRQKTILQIQPNNTTHRFVKFDSFINDSDLFWACRTLISIKRQNPISSPHNAHIFKRTPLWLNTLKKCSPKWFLGTAFWRECVWKCEKGSVCFSFSTP